MRVPIAWLALGVVGILIAAPVARADIEVVYSTSAVFGPAGVSEYVVTQGTSTSKITFVGESVGTYVPVNDFIYSEFGKFYAGSDSSSWVSLPLAGVDFKLTVTQTLPDPGTATIKAELTGKLKTSGSKLLMEFTEPGNSGTIYSTPAGRSVTYSVPKTNNMFLKVGTLTDYNTHAIAAETVLVGQVSAVPLPATAGVSILLLGGFAVWQWIARRRAQA